MNEKTDKFASGVWFNLPSEKAPDFVKGNLSFAPEKFIEWLRAQKPNEKGYVRLSVKISREGKPYIELDTWEGQKSEPLPTVQVGPLSEMDRLYDKVTASSPKEDIPF